MGHASYYVDWLHEHVSSSCRSNTQLTMMAAVFGKLNGRWKLQQSYGHSLTCKSWEILLVNIELEIRCQLPTYPQLVLLSRSQLSLCFGIRNGFALQRLQRGEAGRDLVFEAITVFPLADQKIFFARYIVVSKSYPGPLSTHFLAHSDLRCNSTKLEECLFHNRCCCAIIVQTKAH